MLTVITGPMFSGKTERLISLCTAHFFAGNKVMAFKPVNDNRYETEFIVSHSQQKWKCMPTHTCASSKIPTTVGADYYRTGVKTDVVAIDEAQFFSKKSLIEAVEEMLYEDGLTVIVSGLSQDSEGKPFGAMPYLLAIADDIVHLKSVCAKTKKIGTATRTYRKDKSNKNQVAVGGAEMYEPRSFEAWLEQK